MARCKRCNKFLFFATSLGYCKTCEELNAKEAEEKRRKAIEEEKRQKAEEERKRKEEERKAEEERKRKEEERKAEEERKRKEEEQRIRKEKENAKKMKPGQEIRFGSYFSTNEETREPIQWIVLECQAGKALLLSKYGIDVKRYHYDYIDTTWKDSTIRSWLNGEFLDDAFTSEEREKIIETTVSNDYSQSYHGWKPLPPGMTNRNVETTTGGENSRDRIFLLSYSEAYKYFKTDDDRIATPTPYAKDKGAAEPPEAQFIRMFSAMGVEPQGEAAKQYQGTLWWTRSPGMNQGGVTVIDTKGKYMHSDVDFDNVTIRPAFWIKN